MPKEKTTIKISEEHQKALSTLKGFKQVFLTKKVESFDSIIGDLLKFQSKLSYYRKLEKEIKI